MRKPKREGIEIVTIKLNGLKMDFSVDEFEYTDDMILLSNGQNYSVITMVVEV